MAQGGAFGATLLPGARALLAAHAEEIPQRDDLCGAFCGALALRAAGIERAGGEPLDQDTVAVAAGSIVAGSRDPHTLPEGETGRRDYRLEIPEIDDPEISGTTPAVSSRRSPGWAAARSSRSPSAGPGRRKG